MFLINKKSVYNVFDEYWRGRRLKYQELILNVDIYTVINKTIINNVLDKPINIED